MNVTLTPAYGRDYKTAKEARAAYDGGDDFILNDFGNRYDGKPINKAQVDQTGYCVNIRFAKLRKVCGVLV